MTAATAASRGERLTHQRHGQRHGPLGTPDELGEPLALRGAGSLFQRSILDIGTAAAFLLFSDEIGPVW
ncbi:hypothetical protein [Micromonospora sp. NPDC006431]|uniref:hypothetical protein n=1 Tax=Micromonospora sp. NPDC006431 TaxID=3364235 RepID=UPI0036B803B3